MIFQDNVLKEYLKNVYFITGTPCGGKTTVSRALGEKYHIQVYDIDEMFTSHQKLSDPEHQPAMNKVFADSDEFFEEPLMNIVIGLSLTLVSSLIMWSWI